MTNSNNDVIAVKGYQTVEETNDGLKVIRISEFPELVGSQAVYVSVELSVSSTDDESSNS